MQKIDNQYTVDVMPPMSDGPKPGFFQGGSSGEPATPVGHQWYNMVQSELMNVVSSAGIIPNKAVLNQVQLAIEAISNTASSAKMTTHEAKSDPHSQYLLISKVSDSTTSNSQQNVASSYALKKVADIATLAQSVAKGSQHYIGNWDASSGSLPSKPTVSSIKIDAYWKISKAGTMGGVNYAIGDELNYVSKTDTFFKIESNHNILSDSVISDRTDVGSSSLAVKTVMDKANSAYTLAGQKMTKSDADLYYLGKLSKASDSSKLEGKTKNEVIAEARSGYLTAASASTTYLSKSSASSTYLSKLDADSHYLGKLSKASDSSKLEGKTKSEVIAEARSGYLTTANASTTYLSKSSASSTYLSKLDADKKYLGKTEKASDSSLLSGKSHSQIIAEARSGLSPNTHRDISNSVTSTSQTVGASSKAVKTAMDEAKSAYSLASSKMTKASADSAYLGKMATANSVLGATSTRIGGFKYTFSQGVLKFYTS